MNVEDTTKRLHFLWGASHTLLPTVPSLSAFYMQKFTQCAAEEDLNLADVVRRKYCAHCGSIFVPGLNTQVRLNVKKKRKRRKKSETNKEVIFQDVEERNTPKTITMKKKRRIIYFEPSFSSNQTNSTTIFQSDSKHANHQRQNHKNFLSYICTLCETEARFAGSSDIKNILSAGNHNKQTQVVNITTTTPTSMTQTLEVSSKGSVSIPNQNSADSNKPKKKKQKTQLQQLLAEEKRKKDGTKGSISGLNLEDFLSSL
ncbi:14339_t:CDS:2 [Cetraspora pellucida]|uniref:14339_t:CDS:1 n=1 Tax=Cetraspora pellucida TaxID=1433469 RepID=A0A9N9ESE7_9GLOM|nr:14339_t:CDS:2 [Cetraspora pellucida]